VKSSENPIQLEVVNQYTLEEPLSEYHPWELVVEPGRATLLQATSTVIPAEKAAIKWVIDGQEFSGQSIIYRFPTVGTHVVSITFTDPETNQMVASEYQVMGKYVRREIRALSVDDRNRLLNAMYTLYVVDDTQGKALYGPKFKTIDYFTLKHLEGSADKVLLDLNTLL